MALSYRPLPLVAGLATAAAGAVVIAMSGHMQVWVPGLLVGLAALVELGAAALLTRHGGPGMAHIFAGVTALGLCGFVAATTLFDMNVLGAPPIASMLGIFCFVNALFRLMDIVVDRPEGMLAESIDAAATLVIGVTLLLTWRTATPVVVSVAAGIEMLVGGAALFGSTAAWARHPDVPAYDGRPDRLISLGEQVNEEPWPNDPVH